MTTETSTEATVAILSSLQYLVTEAQAAGLSTLAEALSQVIVKRENWSNTSE